MFHLIWYLFIGLLAGLIAKAVIHVHLSLMWTVILGVVGSLVGGCATHLFLQPKQGARFHPAGLIFSTLGAILVLWLWQKYHVQLHLELPTK